MHVQIYAWRHGSSGRGSTGPALFSQRRLIVRLDEHNVYAAGHLRIIGGHMVNSSGQVHQRRKRGRPRSN